jgi:hypothetical protein
VRVYMFSSRWLRVHRTVIRRQGRCAVVIECAVVLRGAYDPCGGARHRETPPDRGSFGPDLL